MKNPFKKANITDTILNVAVGGGANVAIDYVVNKVEALKDLGDTTINTIKIVAGSLVGSMVSNKVARAAADGIATVGAANLISGLIADATSGSNNGGEGANGLPYGTISGRVHMGNRAYRRAAARKVAGPGAAAVMGK